MANARPEALTARWVTKTDSTGNERLEMRWGTH